MNRKLPLIDGREKLSNEIKFVMTRLQSRMKEPALYLLLQNYFFISFKIKFIPQPLSNQGDMCPKLLGQHSSFYHRGIAYTSRE